MHACCSACIYVTSNPALKTFPCLNQLQGTKKTHLPSFHCNRSKRTANWARSLATKTPAGGLYVFQLNNFIAGWFILSETRLASPKLRFPRLTQRKIESLQFFRTRNQHEQQFRATVLMCIIVQMFPHRENSFNSHQHMRATWWLFACRWKKECSTAWRKALKLPRF